MVPSDFRNNPCTVLLLALVAVSTSKLLVSYDIPDRVAAAAIVVINTPAQITLTKIAYDLSAKFNLKQLIVGMVGRDCFSVKELTLILKV